MGKRKHNAKARQNVETIVDETATKKIEIDLPANSDNGGGHDDANALILPSEGRVVKEKKQNQAAKIVSKNPRKKRAALLATLPGELKKCTSTSAIQTRSSKKLNNTAQNSNFNEEDSREENTSAPRISGTAGRKKRLPSAEAEPDSDESREY